MKKSFSRVIALLTAFSLTTLASAILPVSAEAAKESSDALFTSECENAELSSDLQVTTNIYGNEKTGYSGEGFVWMQSSGNITFEVTVPETGMYAVSMKYMQELSEDGRLQYLYVNGKQTGSYTLPYCTSWSDFNFGVQRLQEGTNTIEIKAGWGFAYYDTFTVDYANLDSLDVAPELSDKKATPETQSLMNYLSDVYGKNIISGQQEIYGSGNDGDTEYEFEWLKDLTGKYPAIRGFDLMNYNPLYGWDDQSTERIIEWANERNGIPTVCWHINIPQDFTAYELGDVLDWQKATYKPNSTFDTKKAVIEGTKENEYLMLAIENLAEQLLRTQDANVPIIFRPFHEAEGNGGLNGEGAWFWWGTGGAETYKELWTLLYTTLTEEYGIHNLIWEFNSYTYSSSPAWYPGDNYVDLVAYDKYNVEYNRYDGLSNCPNEDAISSIFYNLVDLTNGKKMVAMSENDTIPNVENLTIEKAGWLYFCPWYGDHLMSETYNYKSTLIDLYQSDYVITLDELPDWKTYETDSTDNSIISGDLNNDKKVNIFDMVLAKSKILNNPAMSDGSPIASPEDVNGDGSFTIADLVLLQKYMLGLDVTLTSFKG